MRGPLDVVQTPTTAFGVPGRDIRLTTFGNRVEGDGVVAARR